MHLHEWKIYISIKVSPKFVPKSPINNILALVQILSWRRSGDKPLSEPMMFTDAYICVTQPQLIKLYAVKLYCVDGS